jgi:uncharacterized membrane protein
MREGDDRIEAPQGLAVKLEMATHEIVQNIEGEWPLLLGLNEVERGADAQLIASAGSFPLLLAGQFGKGRSVAFTSDCAPHWAPPEFVEWKHFERLWNQIVVWSSNGDSSKSAAS